MKIEIEPTAAVMELRQRQPRVESPAFLAFLRRQPCAACYSPAPSEAAHLRAPCLRLGKRETGMGEKPDDKWALPLCRTCHREDRWALHRIGEAAFFADVGFDPFDRAAVLYKAFLAGRRP